MYNITALNEHKKWESNSLWKSEKKIANDNQYEGKERKEKKHRTCQII